MLFYTYKVDTLAPGDQKTLKNCIVQHVEQRRTMAVNHITQLRKKH